MRLIPALITISLAGLVTSTTMAGDEVPGEEAMESLGAFVGDWQFTGTTQEGIPGIDAGMSFTTFQKVQWTVPMKELSIDWTMKAQNGTTFGSGRSRVRWDDFAEAILNTYMGTEGFTSFKGVATLIGVDGVNFDWRGHESSGTGASLNYELSYKLSGGQNWLVDFVPTCTDAENIEPARFTWSRTNDFKYAIGSFADMVGNWTMISEAEDGTTTINTMDISWGPGERALVVNHARTVDGEMVPMGMEVMFLNPEDKRVLGRLIFANGAVVISEYEMIKEDGALLINSVFSGSNPMQESFRGVQSSMLEGDTFQMQPVDMTLEGSRFEPQGMGLRIYRRVN